MRRAGRALAAIVLMILAVLTVPAVPAVLAGGPAAATALAATVGSQRPVATGQRPLAYQPQAQSQRPPPPPRRPHPHRQPWPVTITIQTVPPLASVRLTLDEVPLTTDATGRAAYTRQHNFEKHTLQLVDTSITQPERHYRFVRWAGQRDPDQAFQTTVTGLPMRANYTVTAAFAVQYPVTPSYVDQQGRPVDAGRVSVTEVKSSTGKVLDLPPNGTAWLDASLPVYRKSVLSSSDVSYSLQSVVIDGTNVVDAGRQRFSPAESRTVTFTGQFYDLTVGAHDALFKNRLGTKAVITKPDGTRHVVPFGPDRSVTVAHLPRGTYGVDVEVRSGTVFADQIVLSRTRAVDLLAVSVRDQALVACAVLLAAVGLLLVGRAHWRRFLFAPGRRGLRLFPAGPVLSRLPRRQVP